MTGELVDKLNLRQVVFSFMGETLINVSPMDLERHISDKTGHSRKDVRMVVRLLVDEGILEYRDKNGLTFISLSFNRPVQLSTHIIIAPPGHRPSELDSGFMITLNSGTAFGRGDHPTTQLCVEALDYVLCETHTSEIKINNALDIGTGSGILALVAAKLGVQNVTACDRDNVALNEARENTVINKLDHQIQITASPEMNKKYDLIIANLRYPTLIDLYSQMVKMNDAGNLLVLSGIKEIEMEFVHSVFKKDGAYVPVWQKSKRGWSGVVYKKL